MPRKTNIGKKRQPESKFARRRKHRHGKGAKSEAELRHAKNIREAARRKRRRDEGWISQSTPEVKEVETNETV